MNQMLAYGRPRWTGACGVVVAAAGLCVAAIACAQEAGSGSASLPNLGAEVEPWKVDVYYENDTRYRGKDYTGDRVGLSKFRNTLQAEADKRLGSGWAFRGVLRGTYDGVYRLNSNEYGNNAGGPIELQNTASPILSQIFPDGSPGNFGTLRNPTVPQGGGINNAVATAFGLPPTNAFGFDINQNPNTGLRLLGDRWHSTGMGTVELGVPVRPCNVDRRGCVDFGGYGNKTLSELEAPEFNSRLDFIRELFVKKTYTLPDGSDLFLKVGKQQVVWGRTDLFRVLDVINPIDYSRNNIYDELQDIRIPMWIAQAEYRMGGSDAMQDRNIQVVWNFDQFRADNLGQCGTPNAILDAGCFFRGAKNLWDNGGTVANFAPIPPGTPGLYAATDFGPHQIGIRNVYLPGWSLKNTQLGAKYEGVTKGGIAFSLNALTYRSQLPSLRAFNSGAVNPFTGGTGNTIPPAVGVPVANLIAFDIHFPRVNLIGGSMDFQVDPIKTAVRLEGAFTNGEEFPNTARPELYSKNKVFRSVIGLDRPTFIDFINPLRTTLISGQIFYQHIFNHELYGGPLGPIGMPDWKDNVVGTLLVKAWFINDRLSPQVIAAYDTKARAFAVQPSLDWLFTNDFKLTFGANVKGGDVDRYAFDDCRSCNPYPPFTTYTAIGQSFVPGSVGLAGIEPLGRFRAGPIGAAFKENEIFLTLRYKF
jgi:hypothetical protein